MHRAFLALTGLFALLILAICTPLQASDDHVAIKGYDAVAYFADSKATKGDPDIAYEWDGAVYYFASAKHREMFKADPEKYAPRYRGFCTGALARGVLYVADPENWLILDGRLHIFGAPISPNLTRKDLMAMKEKADKNYKKLMEHPVASPVPKNQ
jgi:YHS domain-containing protein